MFDLRVPRQDGNRQGAFDRSHSAIKRKFSYGDYVDQTHALGEITVRPEDTEGYRQVKARPFLANIRRGEVDCRLLKRKKE